MPKKKAIKKGGNGQSKVPPKDNRVPADKLLLDFLKRNKIALIVDEVPLLTNIIPEVVYTVDKRPRVRVYYADQLKQGKEKPTGEKLDIVN